MKKHVIYFFILFLFSSLFLLSGCDNSKNTVDNNEKNIEVTRTSRNENTKSNSNENTINDKPKPSEEDISVFSTPIIDKDENRQNNIRICTSSLNRLHIRKRKNVFILWYRRRYYCR